jgi:ATP/maltotriose-dependent transcriptional regulator MalT
VETTTAAIRVADIGATERLVNAVKTHLRNLDRKLGTSNREAAVAIAVKRHLLSRRK